MNSRIVFPAAVALCFLARSADAQGAVTTLAVEGRSNENVTVAAAGQFVAAVWSASVSSGTDVFAAVSRDGGATFSAPIRVNALAGDARVGGEQPPHVALVAGKGATPEIVVVWTSKGVPAASASGGAAAAPAPGTRILVARSTDGGKTFGATKLVPGAEGAGNRGWESVAVEPGGKVIAMWLDHRNLAAAMPAGMHHQEGGTKDSGAAPMPKMDPVEKASQSQLYVNSTDGTAAPRIITSGVCYCCKTSLTATADGSIYGVWRHVFAGNQRDIGFAVSHDGGKTFSAPVRVSEDHWQFNGCPENGPAVAIDRDHRAHVAWVTPADGKDGSPLALFYAMSRDGKRFSPRVRIPTKGPAYHVQITTAQDGSLVLAWDELAVGGKKVMMARGRPDASGNVDFKALSSVESGSGQYPAIASTPTNTVVAWVRRTDAGTVIAVSRVAN